MMERGARTILTPTVFKKIQSYSFSQTTILQDFAIGVGHAVNLKFILPDENNKEANGDNTNHKQEIVEVLAIPVFDGNLVS